ncbi:MAG: DUF2306 domain-containing protein [Paracoccaceae bacterium]
MTRKPVNGIAMPIFFTLACLAPVGFGTFRMIEIVGKSDWRLQFSAPHIDNLPLFLHVSAAGLFIVLASLQILPGFRFRHPRWHRRMGKIAIPAGLIGALSGLWISLIHTDISGPLLYGGRIAASSAWAIFILLAIRQLRQHNFKAHGRWMIRAFSLALPAGTLAFILFPVVLIIGEEGNELVFEVVQVAAWAVHLLVAEILIRRPPRHNPSISAVA